MDRWVEWYGDGELEGSDDYYDVDVDVDPDEENRQIEQRERAYERWLDRT